MRDIRFGRLLFGVTLIVIGVAAVVSEVDGDNDLRPWVWVVGLVAVAVSGVASTVDALRSSRRS